MADSLFGALLVKFNASAALVAALPGGLWMGQVAEGTALPFCVLLTTGQTVEWSTGSPYVESSLIQFVVFAKGLATAEAAADLLKAAFDFAALTFTSAVTLALYREGYLPQADELRAPDGEIVYGVTVDYRVMIQRART